MKNIPDLPKFIEFLTGPLVKHAVKPRFFGEDYVDELTLQGAGNYIAQSIALLTLTRPSHLKDIVRLIWEEPAIGREQTYIETAEHVASQYVNRYRDAHKSIPFSLSALTLFIHIGRRLDSVDIYQLDRFNKQLEDSKIALSDIPSTFDLYQYIGLGIGTNIRVGSELEEITITSIDIDPYLSPNPF